MDEPITLARLKAAGFTQAWADDVAESWVIRPHDEPNYRVEVGVLFDRRHGDWIVYFDSICTVRIPPHREPKTWGEFVRLCEAMKSPLRHTEG